MFSVIYSGVGRAEKKVRKKKEGGRDLSNGYAPLDRQGERRRRQHVYCGGSGSGGSGSPGMALVCECPEWLVSGSGVRTSVRRSGYRGGGTRVECELGDEVDVSA